MASSGTFLTRFFGRMKSFFSGQRESAPSAVAETPVHAGTTFARKHGDVPSAQPSITPTFTYRYTPSFITRVTDLDSEVAKSSSAMPASLAPSEPEVGYDYQPTFDAGSLVHTFSPTLRTPEPSTVTGLKEARQRAIEERRNGYISKLEEVGVMVTRHRFDEATSINDTLVRGIDTAPEYADLRQRALANVSSIAAAEQAWKESERIRIEREEAEHRRLEQERLRASQKADLLDAISTFREAAEASRWEECETMNAMLGKAVPFFQDGEVTDSYKAALTYFSDKYGAYLAEQSRLAEQRQAQEDARRRQREEARRRKQVDDAREAIGRMKSAAQEGRWSDYAVQKRNVPEELLSTNETLKALYDEAVSIYDAGQAEEARTRREQEAREEAERRNNDRIERERLAQQREHEEKARVERVKNRCIRVALSRGGECLCLHPYYKMSHGSDVPQKDLEFRETLFSFKNKFGNKSISQISTARAYLKSELCGLLEEIYGTGLSSMYFCTAQASSPQSAVNRYSEFCQMVSAACGINNGFDLIEVIGTKESASSGNGVRGDISNLSVSDAVRGKRIILLDDIITSGKTMAALRNALLAKGALSVDCFAFGRTV